MKNYLITGVSMRSKGGSAMVFSAAKLIGLDSVKYSIISFYPEIELNALEEAEKKPNIDIIPAYLHNWRQFAFKLEAGLMILDLLLFTLFRSRRLLLSCYARQLDSMDGVLEIHGISFSENYGLNDAITSYLRMRLARLHGVDYYCLPQAYGPNASWIIRILARLSLENCRLILPRGRSSLEFLKRLGLRKPAISFMPDLAFSYINPPEDQVLDLRRIYGLTDDRSYVAIIPNMLFIAWGHPQVVDVYVELMRLLVPWRDCHFILLAHEYSDSGMDDREFNNRIYEAFPYKERMIKIDDQLSANEIKALIASCNLTISSRFHGMVSSLKMNVPPFVISWAEKYRETMSLFGLEENVRDYRSATAAELFEIIKAYFQSPKDLRPTLKKLEGQLDGLAGLIARAGGQA